MRDVVKIVIKVLFGSWNGIQIFFYPMLILFWFDSTSLVKWFSGLLNTQVHQLPLTLFLLAFLFICFLLIKFYSFLQIRAGVQAMNKDLVRYILDLHKGLLLILLVAIMIYVLSSFLDYFYGIKIPIRRIYASLFQYLSLTLIIFYYIQSVWTKPFIQRGYGIDRSINMVIAFGRKSPISILRYSGLIVLVIVATVKIYQLLVFNVISMFVDYLDSVVVDGVQLRLVSASSSWGVLYNVVLILTAFLISNILFAPLTVAGEYLLQKVHPIKMRESNAQKKSQTQE